MILSQDVSKGKATTIAQRTPEPGAVARDAESRSATCRAANAPLAHDRLEHFVGFDWASDHHDVVVVDRAGRIVRSFRFDDTPDGWQSFRETLTPLQPLAVVVETRAGALVERLLDFGLTVFPISPKSAQRYRDRKAPAGTKNDQLDAWSMADALRSDGHAWRPMRPDDPATQELRLLCRDEVHLIELRTSLVLQLRAALGEYFHAALGLFDEWTLRAAWEFVVAFPTPAAAVQAGRKAWQKFFTEHGLSRGKLMERRLATLD
jgi:transposase